MRESDRLFDKEEIRRMIEGLAADICAGSEKKPYLVGIRNGGETMAKRLGRAIAGLSGQPPAIGAIDIALYRDDWTRLHSAPKVGSTELPSSLAGLRVVLVDDVLYTGRTVRAALDALIDFGRPARIELAVLVDRGGRELPIQADYVGAKVDCAANQVIDVTIAEDGEGENMVVRRERP